MQIDYKRDLNHTYVILQEEKEPDTASYQIRMLLTNAIPGLLDCKIGKMDDKTLFYYEVTSRQSLQSVFEQRSIGAEGCGNCLNSCWIFSKNWGSTCLHRTASFCSRSWFLQMQIWRTFPSVICRESRDTQAVFRSRSGS